MYRDHFFHRINNKEYANIVSIDMESKVIE